MVKTTLLNAGRCRLKTHTINCSDDFTRTIYSKDCPEVSSAGGHIVDRLSTIVVDFHSPRPVQPQRRP